MKIAWFSDISMQFVTDYHGFDTIRNILFNQNEFFSIIEILLKSYEDFTCNYGFSLEQKLNWPSIISL